MNNELYFGAGLGAVFGVGLTYVLKLTGFFGKLGLEKLVHLLDKSARREYYLVKELSTCTHALILYGFRQLFQIMFLGYFVWAISRSPNSPPSVNTFYRIIEIIRAAFLFCTFYYKLWNTMSLLNDVSNAKDYLAKKKTYINQIETRMGIQQEIQRALQNTTPPTSP